MIPTESQEQQALFQWAAFAEHSLWGELWGLYHIPNGGSRNKAEAARLKAEGVKKGVPDICLPVPRGGYHGLYIELKRQKGGRLSEEQKEWLRFLSAQGYKAVACMGWEDAMGVIDEYLREVRA